MRWEGRRRYERLWEREKRKRPRDGGGRYGILPTAFAGGLWLANLKAAAASAGVERQAAALLLGIMLSLFLAGLPAGWVAGGRIGNTPVLLWLSMAGAWLAPVVAWFAGLEPKWPVCWLAAFAQAFIGSWVGLGVGVWLAQKKGRQ